MLGGGMRQAGILAAAGLFALERNVERLAEDHANARQLAAGLAEIDGVIIDSLPIQTNMVFLCLPPERADALARFLRPRGILVAGRENLRLVTHRDVTAADVATVIAAFRQFFTDSTN
jgi:threonine aldolase